MAKPYVIAVNAVSGGGKTTLGRLLRDTLSAEFFCFDDFDDTNIHPDDMFDWWKRGADLREFDCPGMFDTVSRVLQRGDTMHVILDYPFGRDHPRFERVIDLSVFIDTPLDIALARRVLRDYADTGEQGLKNLQEDLTQYLSKARHAYLDSFRHAKTCDLILNGCKTPTDWVNEVLASIRGANRS